MVHEGIPQLSSCSTAASHGADPRRFGVSLDFNDSVLRRWRCTVVALAKRCVPAGTTKHQHVPPRNQLRNTTYRRVARRSLTFAWLVGSEPCTACGSPLHAQCHIRFRCAGFPSLAQTLLLSPSQPYEAQLAEHPLVSLEPSPAPRILYRPQGCTPRWT
jgi:hypothetical protein